MRTLGVMFIAVALVFGNRIRSIGAPGRPGTDADQVSVMVGLRRSRRQHRQPLDGGDHGVPNEVVHSSAVLFDDPFESRLREACHPDLQRQAVEVSLGRPLGILDGDEPGKQAALEVRELWFRLGHPGYLLGNGRILAASWLFESVNRAIVVVALAAGNGSGDLDHRHEIGVGLDGLRADLDGG